MELNQTRVSELERRVRLLLILDAANRAAISPIPVMSLHAFAYLANVLAPVWRMTALDGRVLKRKDGPFYPELQRDLDGLVGQGLVRVSGISHVLGRDGAWRIEGSYALNDMLCAAVLSYVLSDVAHAPVAAFVQELGYALSALSPEDLAEAFTEDASYADPRLGPDNVLDIGEWEGGNPSEKAARYLGEMTSLGRRSSMGERVHLYVRHLRRRLHAE